MKYIILLSTMLISCGQNLDTNKLREFNEYRYINDYLISKDLVINDFFSIPVEIVESFPKPDKIGASVTYKDGHKAIQLLRSYWESNTQWQRTTLLAHEIGHAYCNLEHSDEVLDIDGHKSIMSTVLPRANSEEDLHIYLDDLVEKCKDSLDK